VVFIVVVFQTLNGQGVDQKLAEETPVFAALRPGKESPFSLFAPVEFFCV
jgi:hypothetical protein